MRKQMVATMLAGVMAASALTGCGSSANVEEKQSSTESGVSEKNDGNTDSASASSDSKEGGKTKLNALFIAHPLTADITTFQWLQELEDAANVDVEWEVIRSDWDTTKPTRFAAGDIPDLVFNATTDADYQTYSGLFLDMAPLLSEELTPNVMQMFKDEPDEKTLCTTMEGNIYGLPKFQGKWPKTNTVMFINQKWLDNVGMEVPKTFSELKKVLKAFKEQDANGNGDPNDEIPLDYNAGTNNAFFNSAYSLTNLIGGLGIQTTNWGTDAYFVENDKVKNYAVDDRYKLFMKYIADLYSEGLINENALTNDYSQFQSLSRGNENGDAVVGCVFGWEETDKFGNDLASQYVPVPALDYDIDCAAGTYDTRWRDDYSGLNMSTNRVSISSKCDNPEAALRFIDQFYGEDASVEVLFGGISDGCLEKTGDHSYKVLDPKDPSVDPGTWKWTMAFADNGPMYIRRDDTIQMSVDMDNALREREVYDKVLDKATVHDSYPQMFMKYSADDQNRMAVLQAAITQITDAQWSQWMTGAQDIDSTWDSYVQQVNDAGLPEVLEIRQKAFDEYLKTTQQ